MKSIIPRWLRVCTFIIYDRKFWRNDYRELVKLYSAFHFKLSKYGLLFDIFHCSHWHVFVFRMTIAVLYFATWCINVSTNTSYNGTCTAYCIYCVPDIDLMIFRAAFAFTWSAINMHIQPKLSNFFA